MTRQQSLLKIVATATAVTLPLLWCSHSRALGQEAARLSDKDVKQIIEAVDQNRDRFEDQLDGNIKDSIIRSATGEISVSRYLDDLQDNVKHLKERFSDNYAASKEAETVLRQATEINTGIKSRPGEIKGGSEWDTLSGNLTRLAAAYGTSFPLAPDAAVRRINDAEAASTAEALARAADQMKSKVDKDTSLQKTDRDALKKTLSDVSNQAKTVKSRVGDSNPATAEARQLFATAGTATAFMQAHPSLLPGTTAAWDAVNTPLSKLRQAYGMK